MLTDIQIARMCGIETFERGSAYARDGKVQQLLRSGDGMRLVASVSGSRARTYTVTVRLTKNAADEFIEAAGGCSCPVRIDCKHVAAVLIVARSRFPSPSTEPALAAWEGALSGFRPRRTAAAHDRTPFAIHFELIGPNPSSRDRFGPAHGRQPDTADRPRLAMRPLIMGAKGRWIRGSLTWDNLGYLRGTSDMRTDQRDLLGLIHRRYTARSYALQYEQRIYLDGFEDPGLWELLAEARQLDLAMVSGKANDRAVGLSRSQARVSLDITRATDGLALSPHVIVGDEELDDRRFSFVGNPGHGVYAWDPGDDTASLSEARLRLVRLDQAASKEVRALLLNDDRLLIPADAEPRFAHNYLPLMRTMMDITSTDGSFSPPEQPRPQLRLSVNHRPDHRTELSWEWSYRDRAGNEAYAHPLFAAAGGDTRRDEVAEHDILRRIDEIVSAFPTLTEVRNGEPRLLRQVDLVAMETVEFLATVLPALGTVEDLVVTVTGTAQDYREAGTAPVVELSASQNSDDRDWFDLGITVSIENEPVPFVELFGALAAGQETMILPSGTYFSLRQPQLEQLRRLIEEARTLQDPGSKTLRLNRYQTDLWEELAELGVVRSQASAWRTAVEALADTADPSEQPLPAAIEATLRDYQQAGYSWLSFLYDHRLGGILADDMGLGKTLQTLAMIARAREQGADIPFLVVAPTSVVSNWAAECAKFAPSLTTAALTETEARRGEPLAEVIAGADIVITSYALFRLDYDSYEKHEWAGLVLDEAQFIKNHQSKAHQCARLLNTPFKLAITGTPLENKLIELWSLLSVVSPGLFPSPTRFTDYYVTAIEKDDDRDRLAQLRRRIRPFMLRRTKEQVATELPAKQEQVLELELHPRHRKIYQLHLQRERQKILGLIENLNSNRFEIFRSLTMLRQLSLDPRLHDGSHAAVPSVKLDALDELLGDALAESHRVLVFSQFTGYLALIRERLDAAGVRYAYLDGRTRNRQRAIETFTSGEVSVFLISLKAGGFGINLTEADYCIMMDPWWNPATEAQAIDRAHRIGQRKTVMVYRLVAKDTIEEKVMALKASKSRLFSNVLDGDATAGAALTAADIRSLLE
jgi:superfamily II DNA or RNA helicase